MTTATVTGTKPKKDKSGGKGQLKKPSIEKSTVTKSSATSGNATKVHQSLDEKMTMATGTKAKVVLMEWQGHILYLGAHLGGKVINAKKPVLTFQTSKLATLNKIEIDESMLTLNTEKMFKIRISTIWFVNFTKMLLVPISLENLSMLQKVRKESFVKQLLTQLMTIGEFKWNRKAYYSYAMPRHELNSTLNYLVCELHENVASAHQSGKFIHVAEGQESKFWETIIDISSLPVDFFWQCCKTVWYQ